jgi:aldose sugar dehydrogenase
VNDPARDDKIYSWGHRNPQGIAVHPVTGEIWSNEHGPKGGDELNLIRAGHNYGWPFTTHGVDYSGAPLGVGPEMDGMTPPVFVFEGTVAPSGLAVYAGAPFARWEGDLLNGGLISQGLIRVRVQDGKVVEHEQIPIGRRIRDVKVAGDGSVWVVTEHEDGEVLRLTPAR